MKWKTKDGRILDVKDMTTDHIKNCLKMLETKLDEDPGFNSCDSDSDGAYWCSVSEDRINSQIREYLNNGIDGLKNELKIRLNK
jgi:hypothetical protein